MEANNQKLVDSLTKVMERIKMNPETLEQVNRIDPGMISYIDSLLSDQSKTDVDNG